jgi:cysteine desulfurase
VGIAHALELSAERMPAEEKRLAGLRQTLEAGLTAAIATSVVHAGKVPRAPHILGLGIPGLARDVLPSALDVEGIGASAGSACVSGSTAVSPTMQALYGSDAALYAPLRLSLGWTTTATEIADAVLRIPPIVNRIRGLEGHARVPAGGGSGVAPHGFAWSTSSSGESDE